MKLDTRKISNKFNLDRYDYGFKKGYEQGYNQAKKDLKSTHKRSNRR